MSSNEQPDVPEKQTTVKYQGRDVQGVVVEVMQQPPPYDFVLSDGSTIRFVHALTEVVRVIGEFSKEGKPVYVMRHILAPAVISPPELCRPDPAEGTP